jgi:hypothetical protein
MNTAIDRTSGRSPHATSRLEEWLNRMADALLEGVERLVARFNALFAPRTGRR